MRTVPSLGAIFLFAAHASFVFAQENPAPVDRNSTQPKTEKEYFSEGRLLERKKNYQGAVERFEQAIALNPRNKSYYHNLGFCLKQLERFDDAIAAFNQATGLDSSDGYAYRELGLCYYDKKDSTSAIDFLRAAISINPSDELSHFWLGYIFYQTRNNPGAINSLDEALKINPNDFEANYWRGLTALRVSAFNDASRFLSKAVEIRPKDFNARLWLGMSLVRERKFKEAIPYFEKAQEIKPDDQRARFELFACYLATNQPEKAGRIYPRVLAGIAGALVFVYCVWLGVLLPFSLPVRAKMFPGFWFSVAWLGLFFEGQIAFLLLLAALPRLGFREVILNGTMLAGLPIVAAAFAGFARQPWGEPFKWPLRFGSVKIILISVLLIFVTVFVSGALTQLYTYLTHKPFPLQRTISLIRSALQANPVTAWIGIALVIPCVEEILFRGLLFGALQKFMGVTGALLVSSLIFVCVHLQFFGFLTLFMLGLILGWARMKSGSLGLPIALHSLNNAIALAVLTFGPPPPGT